MMSIDEFDPAPLLEPIPGELPCGSNLEFTPEYETLRLARMGGDSGLPAGLWEREVRKIDWAVQQRHCSSLLAQRSKDLQVAAWLVEALVQRFGLGGLVRGAAFFATFAEVFWEGVYPPLEESDASLRMRSTNWLLRSCQQWFASSLLDDETGDSSVLYEAYVNLENDFSRLDRWLAEKSPEHSPSFEEVKRTLQERRMQHARQSASTTEGGESRFPAVPSGMTRELAYEQLDSIAKFLARAEPHSPVSMVLMGLVGWRHASFADLLMRLPQSGPNVYELLKLFGPDSPNS